MDNYSDIYGVAAENCVPQETVLTNVKLAHAYVPFEKMCDVYMPIDALKRGTAFPPLHNLDMWNKTDMRGEDYE